MNSIVRISLCISALTALFGQSAGAVEYKIRDLCNFGEGRSVAFSINDSGQVVGYCEDSSDVMHPFIWDKANGLRYMQTLAGMSGLPHDINNKGQIAGISFTSLYMGARLTLWDAATGNAQDLGVPKGYSTLVHGFNDAGQVAASYRTDPEFGLKWSPAVIGASAEGCTLTDMEPNVITASGINNRGQVTGSMRVSGDAAATHAYLWDPTFGYRDLGIASHYSAAQAVNNNSQVVGSFYTSSVYNDEHAFFWDNTSGPLDIGTLGGRHSIASAINDKGQVVGYASTAPWPDDIFMRGSETHAFVWESGSGMRDLGTLGGNFSHASSINSNGWIVGSAFDADGNQRAVLWEPVPEPSSLLALLSGLASIGGLATFRKR